MPSSESHGSRSTRKAAALAALAIRNDAAEATNDTDTPRYTSARKAKEDKSENAFAEIMANRSQTKATKPQRKISSSTTPKFLNDSSSSTNLEEPIPDMEDLVAEAAKVRITGEHSPDYHRFLTLESRQQIHNGLLAWYDVNHRKLPWRRDYHSPVKEEDLVPGQRAYEVWVSEIMCQQTQVGTVIPYFNTWMAKWPTIAALAAADIEEVNKVWTGLGYYSRASRLHAGAQKVVKEFNGVLPSDPVLLEKEVPGVGRYTAGAIVSHAYNVPAELVDGNVIRVLSRLRAIGGDVKNPKVVDLHWRVAKDLLNKDRPGCFNQALMELGAIVCTPQNPKCGECPVQSSCRAYAEVIDLKRSRKEAIGASKKREIEDNNGQDQDEKCELCLLDLDTEGKEYGLVTQYPRKAVKKAPREEECAVSIVEHMATNPETGESKSKFLLVKRPEKGLLAGMWEFPTVEQDQLKAHHKISDHSDYKQRSESSHKYLIDTLGMDWINTCVNIQRQDLGSVQHLFSHIRKTYHAEWILIQDELGDQELETNKSLKSKQKSVPETEWLSTEELATAAIPTGINKTFQLLQKYKEASASKASSKRKGVGSTSISNNVIGREKKKVKKEPILALQFKAELENITELIPSDADHTWHFKVQCTKCREIDSNFITMNAIDKAEMGSGRGEANLVMKCKFCKCESSADIVSKPVAYDIENNDKFATILTVDCRGLELVGFEARDGWKAKGAESGTPFEDIDLTDGDWADYDEKGGVPVAIGGIESKFIKVKTIDLVDQIAVNAKTLVTQECYALEKSLSIITSFPNLAAQGVNRGLVATIDASISQVGYGLTLALSGVLSTLELVMSILTGTWRCFLTNLADLEIPLLSGIGSDGVRAIDELNIAVLGILAVPFNGLGELLETAMADPQIGIQVTVPNLNTPNIVFCEKALDLVTLDKLTGDFKRWISYGTITLFAGAVQDAMQSASTKFSVETNSALAEVESSLNGAVFSEIIRSAQDLNIALVNVHKTLVDGIMTVFGNTIFAKLIKGALQCLLFNKLETVERGLT
ncbi:hypothetical protein FBU30_004314 [Linnemannia zychae]|nr:hypothetical protein FBU30_004314 [Linnemannia zychae]